MNHFTAEDFEKLLKGWITEIIGFIPTLVGAIVAFIAGRYIIGFLLNLITKIMIKREVDLTLQTFLSQLIRWTLHIALFLIIIQIIGFPATQFFAILASAGIAVGLALQGSLSNFAGGIMILIFKPFKVGDNIEAKGERGTVKRIGLVSTTLNKFNNEEVIIPNGPLFGDSIINYTREDKRRVKVLVGIGYSSDLQKAKEILLDIAKSDKRAFEEPAPSVFVEELADSSVNISVRFWCNNDDYWDCYFNAIEAVKTRFDAEGIEIPFPQRVLNIVDTSKS